MNAKMIKPMNIISEFRLQLMKRIEGFIHNKFRFKDFVGCFSDSVIIRTPLMTKRTSDFKSVNKIIDDFIFKLILNCQPKIGQKLFSR